MKYIRYIVLSSLHGEVVLEAHEDPATAVKRVDELEEKFRGNSKLFREFGLTGLHIRQVPLRGESEG